MKNIFKLGLGFLMVVSFSSKASIQELTLVTLDSGEMLTPQEDIKSISNNYIQLFDGRIILQESVENIEVMDKHGSSAIIERGSFKIIKTNAARLKVGGDNSGGG